MSASESKLKSNFGKAFLLAFLIFFVGGLFLWSQILNWGLNEMSLSVSGNLYAQQMKLVQDSMSKLPPSFIGPSLEPDFMRKNHQFLAHTINGLNFPIQVFENKILFDSAFPGYSFQQTSLPFWKTYFSEAFNDPNVWVPALLNAEKPFLTPNLVGSWLGGIDILENLGADVITLGTSEVSTSIIPFEMSQLLRPSFAHQPKVLGMGGPGQIATIVDLSAQAIASTGKKVRLVIWGYSFWDAFMEGGTRYSATALKSSEYQAKYPQSNLAYLLPPAPPAVPTQPTLRFESELWKEKLADYFENFSWNDLFKTSNEATIKNVPQLFWDEVTLPELSQVDQEEGFRVRMDFTRNEEALKRIASKARAQYPFLNGVRRTSCDMTEAKRIFEKTANQILKTTDHLLIYLPPVIPELLATLPDCYMGSLRKMLQTQASPKIKIITEDWSYFGLQYQDFVYPGLLAGYASMNINHTNYLGAQKVTARLGELLQEWLAGESQ